MPWKQETATSSTEEEANLPPGQHLVRLAVEPTAEAIRAFVESANGGQAGRRHSAVKWLELASPEEVAYLTARVVLNGSAKRCSLQSVAIKAARAIIDHVDMVTFRGKNRPGYHGLVRKSRFARSSSRRLAAVRKMLESEDSRTAIAHRELLLLGMAAVETLIDATGLFYLDMVPRPGGRGYILRPTEAVQKWLTEQHARSALMEPMRMPMIVRPRRWRSPFTGGYLRPDAIRNFIKSSDRDYLQSLAQLDLSEVYAAVNHIQETPWRINRRVLDVMQKAWDEGGNFAGLPAREDLPLPGKPVGMDEDAAKLLDWKRRAVLVHEHNAKLFSERLGMQQKVWIANKFADEEELFFPHVLDFRGRVYPVPSTGGLHPQSDDTGKALLEFAHGLPLGKTGGYWLAVHLANLFGIDKVSFKERVEWTYDHAAQIIDSALNPLDGSRFWATADNPWMALAASFEFAAFLNEGESYVSRLPIPLDGSNSGLQHFSALLRDPVGARAVNLVPANEPQDVYDQVASKAQERVNADPSPEAKPWRGKVTRKIAKQPTMTYVYSATRFGMQDMILRALSALDAEGPEPYLGGADNYEAAKYLSYVLFDAIAEVVTAATEAMDWLREVAKIAADAGAILPWTTPDGLPIQQAYRIPYGQRIEVHWKGQRMTLMLAQEGTEIDKRGQVNGIAPNFVHSLDGAHLRALARAAKDAGIDHLAVIHDSFATHAARTDELVGLLRETFVEQYRPDLLTRFRDEVAANLPEGWELPPPPEPRGLDLEEVRHSPYLFA